MSKFIRMVFLCEHGHLEEIEHTFGNLGRLLKQRNCICECGSQQKHIGNVDDSDGNAVAKFYKKRIAAEKEISKKYNEKTHTLIVTKRLPRYKIIQTKHDVNYDTGDV